MCDQKPIEKIFVNLWPMPYPRPMLAPSEAWGLRPHYLMNPPFYLEPVWSPVKKVMLGTEEINM